MIRVAVVGCDENIIKHLSNSLIHKVVNRFDNIDGLIDVANSIDLVVTSSDYSELIKLVELCGKLSLQLEVIPEGKEFKREIGENELIAKLMEMPIFSSRPPQGDVDGSYLKYKRVLITGAGGSIGGDLARKIARYDPEHITLVDNSENGVYEIDLDLAIDGFTRRTSIVSDIRDDSRMKAIMIEGRPDSIFHVAARKHVPLMERFPEEAVTTNIGGTLIVLKHLRECGCELFTFVSTDKAADPANVMGATKRVAERIIQHHARKSSGRYCIVRFENVLDSQGNVVYTFVRQLQRNGVLTITSPEMNRYFITRNDASSFIIKASRICQKGEVCVPDAGKPVYIADLARAIASGLGYRENLDYKIVFTKPRPGEKLTEELLTNSEQGRAKKIGAMFITNPVDDDPPNFEENLVKILDAAHRVDRQAIIDLLEKLEPTYKA